MTGMAMHRSTYLAAIWLAILLTCLCSPMQAQTVTVEYIHTDALGSPVAVTNEAGQVIERTNWEPYGAAIGKPNYDGPGYTGHVMDGATGLTYMQQRYYDPGIGRFLSVDPVTASPTTGSNFNRYWYANNNPYKFTDPDGRESADRFSDAYASDPGAFHAFGPAAAAVATAALPGGPVLRGVVGAVKAASVVLRKQEAPKLTGGQEKNLARFEKKFSKENRDVSVTKGKDGSVTMKNEVPGKVPGSKAVYEKSVDASGKTTSVSKTTYGPKGEVVHIKGKLK